MEKNSKKSNKFGATLMSAILLFIIAIAFLIWTIICIRESIVEGTDKMNAISMLVALLGWAPVLIAGIYAFISVGKADAILKSNKQGELLRNSEIITEQKFKEICSREFDIAKYYVKDCGEDEREKNLLFRVFAEILVPGTDFTDNFARIYNNAGTVKGIFKIFIRTILWMIIGLIIGGIATIFLFKYWMWCLIGGLILGVATGCAPVKPMEEDSAIMEKMSINVSIKEMMEARKYYPKYLAAIKYAQATIDGLQDESDRQLVKTIFSQKQSEIYERKKNLQEIAQIVGSIKSTLNSMHSSSSSSYTPKWENSASSVSSRREITDEAGRVQGYTENGRIYSNENDVVGHIEGNQVYDKDFNRVGEVGNDGKITKYK